MKKLFCILALIICYSLNAQVKEGFIKFKMTTGGTGAAAAMLGSTELTIYFKNNKTLVETSSSMFKMKTLTDVSGTLMLSDVMNNKMFVRKTRAELEAEKSKSKSMDNQVTVTKETKKILGYDCKKAIIDVKGGMGGGKITVWFTDKIQTGTGAGLVTDDIVKKINGTPLEIDVVSGPATMVAAASEISAKPVPDAVFNLSTAGYTERKK